MTCLTENQFAQIALQLDDIESLTAHVEQCPACRSKLADMCRITDQLAAMHSEVGSLHAASRARLLAQLSAINVPAKRASARKWLVRQLDRLTINQRVAAGGVGLTTVVGLVLLVIVWSSAEKLSAMERMVNQLRQVTSFSYELEDVHDRTENSNARRIHRKDVVYYLAPASLRATTKTRRIPLPLAAGASGELITDIEEIYRPGTRGILIDHLKRTFFRTPEMLPDSFPDYSPVNWMQRMSEGNVKVIGDLRTKQIQGKTAHGYVMSLGHPDPANGQNAIHVWLDPETDLPIEFEIEEQDFSDPTNPVTNVLRVMNCQWTINLDPALFEPVEPAGYDDTSWPADAAAVAEIVDALKLYSELTGGHFPPITAIRGDILADMRNLANAKVASQPNVNLEELLQRIDRAQPGFNTIARVLRNKHHTGYYAAEVSANDAGKVLMWWPVDIEDAYQVIYGDARTEILPLAEWAKLVPPDMAKSHMPVEYSKPNDDR